MSGEPCHPEISTSLCDLCGECVEVCQRKVIALTAESAIVERPEACDGCGACMEACPEDAIDCAFEIVWDESP